MKYKLIIFLVLLFFNLKAQVFELDSNFTLVNQLEKIIKPNDSINYFLSSTSISKYRNKILLYGMGISSSQQCLHDDSRARDMALLSNGNLCGLFWHEESCVPHENVFLMLDSVGNLVLEKRFAENIYLSKGKVLEKNDTVHVYCYHYFPSLPYHGIVHYQFDLNGSQLDSSSHLMYDTLFAGGGMEPFIPYGDSFLLGNNTSLELYNDEIESPGRKIYTNNFWKVRQPRVYNDTAVFLLYRSNLIGFRSGIGTVSVTGENVKIDTNHPVPSIPTVNSSLVFQDIIRIKKYYFVLENWTGSSPPPNQVLKEGNILIYDLELNLLKREPIEHNFEVTNDSKFLPLTDSTFWLYSAYGTAAFTINFDSIPPSPLPDGITALSKLNLDTQMFPNPSQQQVALMWNKPFTGILKMYSVSGRLILRKRVNNQSQISLSIEGIRPGVYFVKIENDSGKQVLKLIKN